MEQNTDDKAIIKKLFVSEENIRERLENLVSFSQGIFSIVEETGEIFIEDPSNLSNAERIFLLLLGSYFSFRYGIKNGPSTSSSELAKKLLIPQTTIPAPMGRLIDDKIVIKSDKGSYQVNFDNYKKVKEMLLQIRKKMGKDSGGENGS